MGVGEVRKNWEVGDMWASWRSLPDCKGLDTLYRKWQVENKVRKMRRSRRVKIRKGRRKSSFWFCSHVSWEHHTAFHTVIRCEIPLSGVKKLQRDRWSSRTANCSPPEIAPGLWVRGMGYVDSDVLGQNKNSNNDKKICPQSRYSRRSF